MSNEIILQESFVSRIQTLTQGLPNSVNCVDDYQAAAERRKRIKDLGKELDEQRKAYTRPLDELKRQALEFCKPFENSLLEAGNKLGGIMRAWDDARRAEQEAEQRRVNEFLAQQAAAEKAKLEQEALALAKAGDRATAVELIKSADLITPTEITLKPRTPDAQGVQYRSVWKFEITDFKALPDEFKLPDEGKLRKVAQHNKEGALVQGVRFWEEKQLVQR